MKYFGAIISMLIIVGLGWALLGDKESARSDPSTYSFASIQNEVKTGSAKLYDVRTSEEFRSSHFAQAENFPLQSVQAKSFPQIPKNQRIYVYCHSGNRSGQATIALRAAGYTNVVDLGGLNAVQTIGGKLER